MRFAILNLERLQRIIEQILVGNNGTQCSWADSHHRFLCNDFGHGSLGSLESQKEREEQKGDRGSYCRRKKPEFARGTLHNYW